MSTAKVNKKLLSDFYKNIIVMFRGTLIAQIIAVFGAIYLAKIYGEEAYGVFGFFISVISITSIIATLQLENCIVKSKNFNESRNWFNFLLATIPIITLFCFSIFYFISYNFTLEKLTPRIFLLLIIGNLILSYTLVHENLLTYKKKFSILSNAKIVLTICNVALQILLFYLFDTIGLIIGFILSRFLLLLYYFFIQKKEVKPVILSEIRKNFSENSSILKFLFPSNLLNGIANNVMPLLITYFFGLKEAGVYFFSIKILGTPLFLISASVSQVFFQKSSELFSKSKQELFILTKKIVKLNLLIMLLLLILINTFGIYLLELYFKNGWENLRIYTLILSFLILCRSSFNPISSLIVVLDKNLTGLVFNIYLFIINLIAIYFGYIYGNIIYTVYILSFLGALGYIILLLYFLNHLKFTSNTDV